MGAQNSCKQRGGCHAPKKCLVSPAEHEIAIAKHVAINRLIVLTLVQSSVNFDFFRRRSE
jgi:hypothetical protein